MLDPKELKPYSEQFEEFVPSHLPKLPSSIRVQYDYRSLEGKLFSCVAKTIDEAREKKRLWLLRVTI